MVQAKQKGQVGYLSTDPSLVPWKTLFENLILPSYLNTSLPKPHKDDVSELLKHVGLQKSDLALFPHQLSYGMLHRAMLIRILLYKPKILLLDELFSGLDELTGDFIARVLRDYVKDDISCVLVTHSVRRASEISDKILILGYDQNLRPVPEGVDLREELDIEMNRSLKYRETRSN